MINQPYTDENYLAALWLGPKDVIFSYAKRGQAMSCHFATDDGHRHLSESINEFIDWIFTRYPWCKMILAQVRKSSVARLLQRLGFKFVIQQNDITVYQRGRSYGWHN